MEAAAQALLARAREAEKSFGENRWVQARAAFEALVAGAPAGPLKAEWEARRADLDRVLGLVDAVGAELSAAPETPRRVKLAGGTVTLKAVDREKAQWEASGATRAVAWNDVPPEDLLPLLTAAHPDARQREGLAVLAAEQGQPERLCEVLAPLYEQGAATPELDALVARLLEGRPEAPAGGYRLHKGRLLDATAFEQAREDERLDTLAARAADLVARLSKDPAVRKIERMRELRDELDRRRGTALVAIFNEKHYPYPADKGRPPYSFVQDEIDRRVAAVRELWEGEESFKLARSGPAGRMADEAEAALAELEAKGRRQPDLRKALAQVAPYLTGETIRLKDFWRDEAERKLMAYNRWVMQVYNPSHLQVARAQESEQVAVTNAYRMMLGFTVAVKPGDAAYEAIDEANVSKVLDQAQIVPGSIVALRAVRIDDRLVSSARLHSQDMEKRGFFAHEAPPNPATGEPRTSPFDRMRKAGYEGHGASENICAGAGDPTAAHVMWCHSSGHHRNILSSWLDMGTGVSGTRWTQNFGTGGGKPAVIEQGAPEPAGRR
ncbi:MAG: CAP domain-containing protein [Planctomycetia bacterium]